MTDWIHLRRKTMTHQSRPSKKPSNTRFEKLDLHSLLLIHRLAALVPPLVQTRFLGHLLGMFPRRHLGQEQLHDLQYTNHGRLGQFGASATAKGKSNGHHLKLALQGRAL